MKLKFFNLLSALLVLSCTVESGIPQQQNPPSDNEPGAFINDWTYSVYPKGEDNFSTAEFKLWIPESGELNGILVLSGHNNSNSLYLAEDAQWRSFAVSNRLAIAATYLVSSASSHYGFSGEGSGNALILALDKIAAKNNISNFDKLPYFLRGYSAGGIFSYSFSEFFTAKTAAVVDIRGGIESNNTNNTNNLNVPGLILVGEQELTRIESVKSIIANKRSRNGLWSYAIEPNAHHSSNQKPSDNLARIFFTEVLANRSSLNNPNSNFIEEGYLGNNQTKEYQPYLEYIGNKEEASWLIDASFAQAWKEYQ